MKYRKMISTQERLSILGFGLMRLPETPAGKVDEEHALSMMQYAYSHGINYFDTAVPYHDGASEALLGKFLQGIDRASVKIASKLPCWLIKKPQDMDVQLDLQLQKLKTDYIDYYLLHSLSAKSWKSMVELGVSAFMDRALASGKIRHIGFSFHDDYKAFKKIADSYPWEFCQLQVNFVDTHSQGGVRAIKYAAAKKMGVIIMEPLKGGKIVANIPPTVQKVWDSSKLKISPVDRALRWVWNFPEVSLLLSGMSNLEQLKENVSHSRHGIAGSLSDAELKRFQKAKREYLKLLPFSCTGCRYCLPCPQKVHIPSNLGIYMDAHLFGDIERHKFEYKYFVPDEGKADKCNQCGACLAKCPQKINIPQELIKVKELLG